VRAATWVVRIIIASVFLLNVQCALVFIIDPGSYAPGFELSGEVGLVMVRALGIAFLMWNVTYPPVIFSPMRHRTLFGVVVAQQLIGLLGESWLATTIQATGHATLQASIGRFILFDGAGLMLMLIALVLIVFMDRTTSRFEGDHPSMDM
jgi:hypothetical protein